jgi:hypothetical protein
VRTEHARNPRHEFPYRTDLCSMTRSPASHTRQVSCGPSRYNTCTVNYLNSQDGVVAWLRGACPRVPLSEDASFVYDALACMAHQ